MTVDISCTVCKFQNSHAKMSATHEVCTCETHLNVSMFVATKPWAQKQTFCKKSNRASDQRRTGLIQPLLNWQRLDMSVPSEAELAERWDCKIFWRDVASSVLEQPKWASHVWEDSSDMFCHYAQQLAGLAQPVVHHMNLALHVRH